MIEAVGPGSIINLTRGRMSSEEVVRTVAIRVNIVGYNGSGHNRPLLDAALECELEAIYLVVMSLKL